jgi:kynurenine formamidase
MLHKEMRREAHKAFLGRGIRIFEDISLVSGPCGEQLLTVVALPLLNKNIDACPCTILGYHHPNSKSDNE